MSDESFDEGPFPWRNPDKLAQEYREMRESLDANDSSRWILLLKELRVTHGCSILEAERIALSQPTWRRWVERQINSDVKCKKSARWHIRHYGDGALLEERNDRLIVR